MALKAGGSNSAGIIGVSMANWGVLVMCVMGVPLVWCACAIWYGQVVVSHSTKYLVVQEGRVLCRVCDVGHCVMMSATGVWC